MAFRYRPVFEVVAGLHSYNLIEEKFFSGAVKIVFVETIIIESAHIIQLVIDKYLISTFNQARITITTALNLIRVLIEYFGVF